MQITRYAAGRNRRPKRLLNEFHTDSTFCPNRLGASPEPLWDRETAIGHCLGIGSQGDIIYKYDIRIGLTDICEILQNGIDACCEGKREKAAATAALTFIMTLLDAQESS